ncbi:hypothetical protein [Sphingomonas sp. SORGH_AS_0802]|uniref:hypothetical protein n=1 Tax=Sphingomonas sp. SORGH_AS_0802 TaxID=3041800 RepID=UPI00286BE3CE|nr:hypothetical protein [Sphingomonas sp. SORGH_AS_0802]
MIDAEVHRIETPGDAVQLADVADIAIDDMVHALTREQQGGSAGQGHRDEQDEHDRRRCRDLVRDRTVGQPQPLLEAGGELRLPPGVAVDGPPTLAPPGH